MSYDFELTNQKEQPVLSIRTRTAVGNLPQEIGKAFGAVMQYLAEIGENAAGPAFAAYYNMDMENLDVEMGFPVAKPISGKGIVQAGSVPAGKQASCMYKGPYSQMEPVYNALNAWLGENGHEPTGVVYEFYYNSPMEVPESELLTKVVFLLK
ncbi:MAG TPA: GyrI-like domain-containing protein [Clostridia bacterium]|nr:GyrI-like domain-containing protein [Clostridia bacterium]